MSENKIRIIYGALLTKEGLEQLLKKAENVGRNEI